MKAARTFMLYGFPQDFTEMIVKFSDLMKDCPECYQGARVPFLHQSSTAFNYATLV